MNAEPTRHFPKITDKALDALRARIDVRIDNTLEPWCHEATRDNIRHYAHGIGDDNPLWCDPAYAAKTRFGGLVALPSFLFATSRIVSGYVGGIPGVHAMWAGADWTWHKPVLRNQEITTEAWLKDLVEHDTKFAGRAVQQIYHVNFFNPEGDLVVPHRPRSGPGAGDQIQRTAGEAAAGLHRRRSSKAVPPLRNRGNSRFQAPLLGRRHRRRSFAGDGQGADDGHRFHRLRPRVGRAIHPCQQAGVAAGQQPPRPWNPQSFWYSGLSGACALGTGVRVDGGRARGV